MNSMVKHELGRSAYKTRVRECAEAVAAIQQSYPGRAESCGMSPASCWTAVQNSMPETVFRRARHVQRRMNAWKHSWHAAADGDLMRMGRLFLASHRSLQHDYEVSAEELDFLVDTASSFSGVYGCRMTGGGFGGCTVNMVGPERVELFETNITEAYRRTFGRTRIFIAVSLLRARAR